MTDKKNNFNSLLSAKCRNAAHLYMVYMDSTTQETHRRIKRIASQLQKTMARDRQSLKRELTGIKRAMRETTPVKRLVQRLDRLSRKVGACAKKRRERIERLPVIAEFPDLPIIAKRKAIIQAIRQHPVVIISGETGSGKTTQIPKLCLAAGRGADGMIGCTQPRRIAAVTVAERIAEELGSTLGDTIGYKIRFNEKSGPNTFVKIMTDGMLLAETQTDRFLSAYDTLIIDEAHERSLNIDFILGILKTLVKKRKDLKLIITSATIDTEKFSKSFENAPIIEVSGRSFPVEIRYEPEAQTEESTPVEKAVMAVDRLIAESRFGDILIFMPTEGDIRETIELIEGRNHTGVTVYPLFARLSAADQRRAFSNPPGRKIIVATNIAETSLTIPGIKYVVDTGLARISRYNPRSRTTSLPISPISKSSADQRAGRCGRIENGICLRLYPQASYDERPRFTRPEILRANLAEVILRMIALRLGNIEDFPFLDMPPSGSIQDGFSLLLELGAIKPANTKQTKGYRKIVYQLTQKGNVMAGMPIDPRLSCMLIEAGAQGCLEEITVIAAALSIQDPRERPGEKAAEADRAHARFKDPASDFITLLNIWKHYHEAWHRQKKMRDIKRFCIAGFLSFKRMREWRDIHGQLSAILKESVPAHSDKTAPLKPSFPNTTPGDEKQFSATYEKIHKSILSGFLSGIAVKKEGNIYQAGNGRQAMIFPGSGLFNTPKPWIVAAEMVETSRLFARIVAHIDPEWIEPLGKSRCKYTHLNPHWERKRGNVTATEQVSLFGLIIIPDRTVLYGRINPDEASNIFIQSALVGGDVRSPLPFMRHNQALIDTIQDLENKVRRRDLLISETDLFDFYKSRLHGIFDIRSLERLIRTRGNDAFLKLKEEDLLKYVPDENELALYPDSIRIQNEAFACNYQFDPGSNTDGVTIRIPAAASGTVSPDSLEWMVPGLYKEKLAALIKTLPKAYRKQLVPVTDTVEIIFREMGKKEEGLLPALGEFIFEQFGVNIPATAWNEALVPDHLRMRIAITGPNGKEITSGRDPAILHRAFPDKAQPDDFDKAKKGWEKTGITRWDFSDLPDAITVKGKKGRQWIAYPALVPDNTGKPHVDLRLFLKKHQALEIHGTGVRLLYTLYLSRDLKLLKKMLTLPKTASKKAAYFGGEKKIQAALIRNITAELFTKNIRTREEFDAHATAASQKIISLAQNRLDIFLPVLEAVHETRALLFSLETAGGVHRHLAPLLRNIRSELAGLAPENLISLYSNEHMAHLPRYIRALGIRATRAVENPDRDQLRAQQVQKYKKRLNTMLESLTPGTSVKKRNAVEDYFWMLEEFKVSVFAQELKTVIPISPKRLDKKAGEIERMI